MKKVIACLCLMLFYSVVTKATNYYFSTSGNDAALVSSTATPFKTITKLNLLSLAPGDTIFFKCGDTLRGQINLNYSGSASQPIVFASYGTGNKPIISGSDYISTSWTTYTNTNYSGNSIAIYKTTVSNAIRNLFVNGNITEIAKAPNTGFETVSSGVSKSGFRSNFTTLGSSKDWTNASVCVRTSLWTWENRKIKSTSGDSIVYTANTSQPVGGLGGSTGFTGYGFFVYNRLDLLDAAGEWFYDSNTSTLYYLPSNGLAPSTQSIEGTIYSYGIFAGNKSNIIISNLSFQNQDSAGVYFTNNNCSNITLNNCDFSKQKIYGAKLVGTNALATQNTFTDVFGRGLQLDSCSNSTASHNQFKRIGLYRNYGRTDEDNLTALAIYNASNNNIHHNTVDSTGYCGIRCDGNGTITPTVVEKNILSNCMLLLTDGAALKTWGAPSQGIIYRNNFISNCEGNNIGATNTSFKTPSIYYDVYSGSGIIDNNTIELSNSTAINGIYINGSTKPIIKRNVIYGGGAEAMFLNDRLSGVNQLVNDSIYNNTFFGRTNGAYVLREASGNYGSNANNSFNFGKSDSNYFFNPFSTSNTKCYRYSGAISSPVINTYTLSTWQSITGNDIHTYENTNTAVWTYDSSRLFKNPTDNVVVQDLQGFQYRDLEGNTVTSLTLQPWTSKVLIKTTTILPVQLLAFTATKNSNNVLCAWQTSSEYNTQYFKVERSTDGQHFTSIATVAAKGNSSSATSYSYADSEAKNITATTLYYRLTIVDKDGSITTSTVVVIRNSNESKVVIYPNPASDYFTILGVDRGSIKVYSNAGVLVKYQGINAQGRTTIKVNALPKGLYLAQVIDNDGNIICNRQLVVNR